MSNRNAWEINGLVRRKLERRAQTTAFHLNLESSSIVMDLGCSDGFVDSHFQQARFVVGLDISLQSLVLAKHHNSYPNFDFINADGTAVPLREGSISKATLLEVLEHLPLEQQRLVTAEVDRVLGEKGSLIVSVPYREKIPMVKNTDGELVPRFGHLSIMDEEKVTILLPRNYVLKARCHLVNFETFTLARLFQALPIRFWLILNGLFGVFRKGYWIILKYDRN